VEALYPLDRPESGARSLEEDMLPVPRDTSRIEAGQASAKVCAGSELLRGAEADPGRIRRPKGHLAGLPASIRTALVIDWRPLLARA
jgi:hypothetical protein